MNILLVEDKDGMRDMLTRALLREGYNVQPVADGDAAIRELGARPWDLVLTDLKLPGRDGIEVLQAAHEISTDLPVVVMTAFGSIEVAVDAMRKGAFDFITKPFDPDHLMLVLKKALDNRRLQTENQILKESAKNYSEQTMIGESAGLRAAVDQSIRVAAGDTTVLLNGESGTGKELFARLVHDHSPRAKGPFVAVNCAAIPEQLLESEFFGHERGAFTGADQRHIGRFELARGGTIFLDEIGDMDLNLQAKLLRVLQDGELYRVGGEKPVPLDVRVVAATHQDLPRLIERGTFRQDLYYRLCTFPVRIPPLRERREDIALLADHFVKRYARELGRDVRGLSPEAMATLMDYAWPGNVRELQNSMERAVILAVNGRIERVDVGSDSPMVGAAVPSVQADIAAAEETGIPMHGTLHQVAAHALRHYESLYIRQVMDKTGGNKSRASEILGVSYKTLLNKVKEYGIEPVPTGAD
ncbi:MAG: sigma-54 dependent transcriptional regulator [Nitrospirota bacterium]|nr:sigma-54 dependent transcriptional regulator [Nitrospirota bacterium]